MGDVAIFKVNPNGGIEVVRCPQSIRECETISRYGANPVLVTYLLHVGRAEVLSSDGSRLSLEDLIKIFGGKELWIVFSTYLDLRKKGKIPKPGLEPNELYLEKDRVCVYVYEENSIITPEEVISLVEKSSRRECSAVIAVVDMYGDVTYYEVSKINFPKIERR